MEKLQLEALPQDVLGKTEFDVYMKKNIIESLIDDYTAKKASSDKPKTKEEIKKKKREKQKKRLKKQKRAAKQKKSNEYVQTVSTICD